MRHGDMANFFCFVFARLLDGNFGEVANDGIDIAPNVTDFGEFGGLDFEERRIGEFRQTARDLGLADAGRPDHQNIFRRDFVAQRLGHLHAPPAVAQRNGDRALGG